MRGTPRVAGLAFLFVVLVALQYSVRPVLAWRAEMDFLVIGVLLVAVRLRPGAGAVLGCVAGLIGDALHPAAFGAGAVAMTVVGFGASWLKAAFFTEQLPLNAMFLFGAKVVFDAIYLIAEQRVPAAELAMQVGVWSTLSGLVTAAAGLAVLVVFRPFIDTRDGHR